MMGAQGMCGCRVPATVKICGECKQSIVGEARVYSAEFMHRQCSSEGGKTRPKVDTNR